jgi:hypothetical protein
MIEALASLPQGAVARRFLCTSVRLRKDNDVPREMNSSHMSFLTIQGKVFALGRHVRRRISTSREKKKAPGVEAIYGRAFFDRHRYLCLAASLVQ